MATNRQKSARRGGQEEITERDETELQSELTRLDSKDIPRLEAEFARQNADRDVRETAAVVSIRDELATKRTRRRSIASLLDNATVVTRGSADQVDIGSTVLVQIDGKEGPDRFTISHNGNPPEGRITPGAPIAQALLNAHTGDIVTAMAPKGPVKMRVLQILDGSG